MSEIKILKSKIKSYQSEISKLEYQLTDKRTELRKAESQVEKLINEKDKKIILQNWEKLLHIYQKYHPNLFKHILLTCFPIFEIACCGMGTVKQKIYLSDLLELWDKGWTYEGKPLVGLRILNSSPARISYIDNGRIERKSGSEFRKYHTELLKGILQNKIEEKYSATNLYYLADKFSF